MGPVLDDLRLGIGAVVTVALSRFARDWRRRVHGGGGLLAEIGGEVRGNAGMCGISGGLYWDMNLV